MKGKLKIIPILFVVIFAFTGCPANPDKYTEKEHIGRISKRIEERLMTEESGYTDFEVYPLYNQNDELRLFLVELEPVGFVFVKINYNKSPFLGLSMYSFDTGSSGIFDSSEYSGGIQWGRYTITEDGLEWGKNEDNFNASWPGEYKQYEKDENGDLILYKKSYYHVADIENEQRYMLNLSYHSYIPAVKRGDKWLNLISMEEMDLEDEITSKKYANVHISYIPKAAFNL